MEDVAAASEPRVGVGSRLRVHWPLDQMWYKGTVTAYDAGTGLYTVAYDDGEVESCDLAKEEYFLEVSAKRKREAPTGGAGAAVAAGAEDAEMADAPTGAGPGAAALAAKRSRQLAEAAAGPPAEDTSAAAAGAASGASAMPLAATGANAAPSPAPPAANGGLSAAAAGAAVETPARPEASRGLQAGGAPEKKQAPYGPAAAYLVKQWLEKQGLGKYAPIFDMNEVDFATIPSLTIDDLKDMPIRAVGARRKLMVAIEGLRKQHATNAKNGPFGTGGTR